jgi:DNA invertase Pin-like site-specific DNA recombinase
MRLIGYTRVSTQDQGENGASLAAQEAALRVGAHGRYDLVDIISDTASGKSLDRPGFQSLLERIRSGEADGVVVAKLDRLSRSLIDFANLLERSRAEGWAIVALDLGIDTSSPSGELIANVMMAVAQWERRTIGERTKVVMAEKKRRGEKVGRPSAIPPELVRTIKAKAARGKGASAIARDLNEAGIPTARGGTRWYPSTVRYVLQGSQTPQTHSSVSTTA